MRTKPDTLSPTERIALELCTEKELTAYLLWSRGCGYRRTATLLGISLSSARDRIDRARRKVDADPRTKETS